MTDKPEWTRLTGDGDGDCDDNDCPNVYKTNRGTFVVQGDGFEHLKVPAGEFAVEIPESTLREAFRALGW
ncbi:hypothetical protein AB0I81_45795 [Nonomuraea sp. NPDC050404]|uniref:hypothetical protein n=1 Tax=Nonomuraea sp. NPDC050404 TaxID=3155783 RepID=UPI0033FAE8E9